MMLTGALQNVCSLSERIERRETEVKEIQNTSSFPCDAQEVLTPLAHIHQDNGAIFLLPVLQATQ